MQGDTSCGTKSWRILVSRVILRKLDMELVRKVTVVGSNNDTKLEILRHEYESLRSEIELAIRNQIRILGYGGTVLGVFAGLGIIRPSILIIAALPFISFFFAILWSIEQTRMMRAGDYLATIEDRANDEYFDEPVLLWESWLRYRGERQPEIDIYQIHYFTQYIVIGIFILTVFIGIITVWTWKPESTGLELKIGLSLLYSIFILIMGYVLTKVVKHKDVSGSFQRFFKNTSR